MTRTLISFPLDVGVDAFEFYRITNNKASVSPFTGRSRVALKDGARWYASMRFNRLTEDETRELDAFLSKCNGTEGTFYIPAFRYRTQPEPPLANIPRVSDGNQTGTVMKTTNWPTNIRVLKKGDYVEIAGQMRGITEDIYTNQDGHADLRLSHRFYKTPVLNDHVNYWSPKALMMLKDEKQGKRPTDSTMLSSFRLQMVEVIL